MEDHMAWTDITRRQHRREGLRYPSDLTDAEWAVIARLLPSARPGGRPRATDLRGVVNAILYLATGCESAWKIGSDAKFVQPEVIPAR
jgi:putative transposase